MTTVIAVSNNKGGVGKTTTCLSLGGSLAEAGQTVLLVDLDPQAHLTASLGLHPATLRNTVGDVLLGQKSLIAASRETGIAGLDLVPASRELAVLDKILYRRPRYEYRLRQSLDSVRHQPYDAILLDCPPAFGTLTLNTLTAADTVVIPVQCEYYAVQSLRQALDLVDLVRRKTNPRLTYRLLVTMFDVRNKVHRLILQHLQTRFGEAVFHTLIQVDTRLREAPAFGLPVTHYAPRTRAARQYSDLARELRGHPTTADTVSTHQVRPDLLTADEFVTLLRGPRDQPSITAWSRD